MVTAPKGLNRRPKRSQALGTVAVVIRKKDFHEITACPKLAGVAVRTIL